ncbi:MAG: hypothetical protein GKC07_01140 [Methanomicrobiales archaeon]|nr:hypothetical protein [Methanomicrobiales archaeon]
MQLPRGTFRGLKRGSGLHSLIREMEEECLSGYCKIVSGETSILLVFSDGKIVLAEYGSLAARAAMDAISRTGEEPVDAVLHGLSDAQIELALEFNPSARIDRAARAPTGMRSPPPPLRHNIPRPHPEPRAAGTGSGAHRAMEPGFPGRGIPSEPADDETSLLMRDLDALDALDIQAMTEKFRANCRQMIEKLELEHLLEKSTRKGEP